MTSAWVLSSAESFARAAVYALRSAGRADGDRTIAQGTKWLLDHQRTDGGWSSPEASVGPDGTFLTSVTLLPRRACTFTIPGFEGEASEAVCRGAFGLGALMVGALLGLLLYRMIGRRNGS